MQSLSQFNHLFFLILAFLDSDGVSLLYVEFDPNPEPNTVLYDVKVNDSSVRQYAANIISQNRVDRVDNDG